MERKQTREGFLMNENERNAILEYEQILQGKSSRTKLSTTYFRADSNEQNHKTAVHILRYIFTKIYKWTPLDVMNKASKQMISDLKITIPYSKLIFPKEMNPKRDYFYLAKILFRKKSNHLGNTTGFFIYTTKYAKGKLSSRKGISQSRDKENTVQASAYTRQSLIPSNSGMKMNFMNSFQMSQRRTLF